MAKWADYAITAVKFKKERRHIEQVKVRADNDKKLANEQITTRSEVVRLLENGTTFVTAYKDDADKWNRGDDVNIVKTRGIKFIRTDGFFLFGERIG